MTAWHPVAALVLVGVLALTTGCTQAEADGEVEVSGSPQASPAIAVPGGDPPSELEVTTLVQGEGDTVEAGDLLVVDYTGVLWDTGEEFDSSWGRGQPAAFGIGVDQVIDGWDEGLVGQSVGSRVQLVIPPELGYGDQDQGTIPPNSTLVFVVDIRDAFSAADAVGGSPVPDVPDGFPAVTGDAGVEPTVDVTDAEEPEETTSALLVAGDGEPLDTEGSLAVHVVQVAADTGEVQFSSWESVPQQISAAALPGLVEALSGQGAGSRAVTVVSAEDNEGQPLVLVWDVLGDF